MARLARPRLAPAPLSPLGNIVGADVGRTLSARLAVERSIAMVVVGLAAPRAALSGRRWTSVALTKPAGAVWLLAPASVPEVTSE